MHRVGEEARAAVEIEDLQIFPFAPVISELASIGGKANLPYVSVSRDTDGLLVRTRYAVRRDQQPIEDVRILLVAEHPPVAPIGMAHSSDFANVQHVGYQRLVLANHTAQGAVQAHVDGGQIEVLRELADLIVYRAVEEVVDSWGIRFGEDQAGLGNVQAFRVIGGVYAGVEPGAIVHRVASGIGDIGPVGAEQEVAARVRDVRVGTLVIHRARYRGDDQAS
ncbi:MAG: hypothetical protein IPI07_19365 [Flavobacteriales bacterium]|nr:hypothetical protein [Flavobacteriales bacterium]